MGTIYTIGNANGTCGAAADNTLIPVPSTGTSDPVVVVGGGAGKIVGGTGFYHGLKGEYVDRVFVGLSTTGQVLDYSGLFFSLMPKHRFVSDNPAS